MSNKVGLVLIIIILGLGGIFLFYRDDFSVLKQTSQNFITNDPSIDSLKRDVQNIQDHIFTSGPLRKDNGAKGDLTVSGVIEETNKQRALANLPALNESSLLNKAAEAKIDDMFKNQYFDHISPDDKGPAELAKLVDYNFIVIGENLALGNFKNDQDLVNSWMESQGHKENILRTSYEEIGIAVRQGLFEGDMVWLAVQEFGTPSLSCPVPDQMLEQAINNNQLEITKQELNISNKKIQIDNFEPKNSSEHISLIEEYNRLIETYNILVSETRLKIGEYNNQANNYNNCLGKYAQ